MNAWVCWSACEFIYGTCVKSRGWRVFLTSKKRKVKRNQCCVSHFFVLSFVSMQRCNAVAEQKEVLLSFVSQKAQSPGQVKSHDRLILLRICLFSTGRLQLFLDEMWIDESHRAEVTRSITDDNAASTLTFIEARIFLFEGLPKN